MKFLPPFFVLSNNSLTSHLKVSSTSLLLSASLLSGQVAFQADFENDTGNNAFGPAADQWTVNPNTSDDATTGLWERGDPTETQLQPGTTPSGVNALVTGANNTGAGDNDVDGGLTSVRSPEIAIPAGAASVSLELEYFFSWAAGTDAIDGNDFLRITAEGLTDSLLLEVIPAAGSQNLDSYKGFVADLTSFRGETITLLIEVTDEASAGGLIEAGLDDVSVTVTLPIISGAVRYDVDGDGDLANSAAEDRGIPSTTLELFADGGGGVASGPVLQTVTTDADGNFSFAPQANGNYVIVSTNAAGGVSTADSGGANDDLIAVTLSSADVGGNVFLDTTNAPGLLETVATYYFPYAESDIFTALDTLNAQAENPVSSYNSLSIAYDNTIILYDHWEDNGSEGYEPFRNAPVQQETQVWGDGNLVNGVAPGYPDDLLDAGDVVLLTNTFDTSSAGSEIFYDGRDKISTSKYVAITRAAWASVTNTLLAGAWELYPTSLWGTVFTLPVGEDLPDAVDAQVFEYVGASVMSAFDGNEIRINGALVATINEGETFTLNGGLNVGDEISTSRSSQVQLITGDIGATFESRWYTLPPTVQFSNSYVAPVSTPTGSATLVWLFNPNTSPIDVVVESSSLADETLTIPADTVISYEVTNGEAVRFASTNEETFFAIASVDSGDANPLDANGNETGNENLTNDWGFSLVPDVYLTPLVVVGLAPGDDPTFVGRFGELSSDLGHCRLSPRKRQFRCQPGCGRD